MKSTEDAEILRLESQIYEYNPHLQHDSEEVKQRRRQHLKEQLQASAEVKLDKLDVCTLMQKSIGILDDICKMQALTYTESASRLSETSDDDEATDRTWTRKSDASIKQERGVIRRTPRKRKVINQTSTLMQKTIKRRTNSTRSLSSLDNVEHSSSEKDIMLTIPLVQVNPNSLKITIDLTKINRAQQINKELRDSDWRLGAFSPGSSMDSHTDGAPPLPLPLQSGEDETLSRLISDVLVEPNAMETWCATNALANINNNVGDNYDVGIAAPPQDLVPPSARDGAKKRRKNTKKATLPKGPPKKRGRKPGSKTNGNQIPMDDAEHAKSDLSKYWEFFSNDCALPGSTTPAGSSTMSQQLVTSTTQHLDTEQPITYYIEGDWTNGGNCQLISTGNVDGGQIQEDMTELVNFIESPTTDVGNNVIARVLEGGAGAASNVANNVGSNNNNNSTTTSIQSVTLPVQTYTNVLTNSTNIIQLPVNQTTSLQYHKFVTTNEQQTQTDLPFTPPPAHGYIRLPPPVHSVDVLDLSEKSQPPLVAASVIIEDDCAPIDLSLKSNSFRANQSFENQIEDTVHTAEEESDDNFIRRLIKSTGYDCKTDESQDFGACDVRAVAPDMPLLDIGNVVTLDKNGNTTCNEQVVKKETTSIAATIKSPTSSSPILKITHTSNNNNNNQNFSTTSTTILNSDNRLNTFVFSDESSKALFDNLLEITHETDEPATLSENSNNGCVELIKVDNDSQALELNEESDVAKVSAMDTAVSNANNKIANAVTDVQENKSVDDEKPTVDDMEVDYELQELNNSRDESVSAVHDANLEESCENKATQPDVESVESKTEFKISESVTASPQLFTENNVGNELDDNNNNNSDKNVADVEVKEETASPKTAGPNDVPNLKDDETKHEDEPAPQPTNTEVIKEEIKRENEQSLNIKPPAPRKRPNINIISVVNLDISSPIEDIAFVERFLSKNKAACLLASRDKLEHTICAEKIAEIPANNAATKQIETKVKSVEEVLNLSDKDSTNMLPEKEIFHNIMPQNEILYVNESIGIGQADNKDCAATQQEATKSLSTTTNTDSNDSMSPHVPRTSEQTAGSRRLSELSLFADLPCNHLITEKTTATEANNTFAPTAAQQAIKADKETLDFSLPILSDNPQASINLSEEDTANERVTITLPMPKLTLLTDSQEFFSHFDLSSSDDEAVGGERRVKQSKEPESSEDILENEETTVEKCSLQSKDTPIKNEEKKVLCSNSEKVMVKNEDLFPSMSLLEMESQFDRLDYEDDMEDDALSLATSCFNSPDDDRFTESQLLEEEPKILSAPPPDTTDTSKTHTSTDASSILRKFRIPKLSTTTTSTIAPAPAPIEKPPTQIPPNNTNANANKKYPGIERITRTLSNNCAESTADLFGPPKRIPAILSVTKAVHNVAPKVNPELSSNKQEMPPNRVQFSCRSAEGLHSWPSLADITQIFGVSCLRFLSEKCFELACCQHSHQYNNSPVVYAMLQALPLTDLYAVYRFSCHYKSLFRRYFNEFVGVFVAQNNRQQVLNMVYDVQRYVECAQHLTLIFAGLLQLGFSQVNACRQILNRCRDRSKLTIDIMMSLIMDSDWTMFVEYIESFIKVPGYKFTAYACNRMAQTLLVLRDSRLIGIWFNCLATLDQGDKLETESLQLLTLLKSGSIC